MLAWGVSPRNQIPQPTRTEPRSGDTEYMPQSTDRTVVPPIKRFCSARNAQSVGSAWRGIGRTIPVGLMLCRRYAALLLRNSRSWGSRPKLTFCRRHAACSGGDACSAPLSSCRPSGPISNEQNVETPGMGILPIQTRAGRPCHSKITPFCTKRS